MRFVLMLGFIMVAARLSPMGPNQVTALTTLLIMLALFDLVDFVMNIIKTFRNKPCNK